MKQVKTITLIVIISIAIAFLAFDKKRIIQPKQLYQVYLDDLILGVIESKDKLENYIDNQGKEIKEKYDVETVYAPAGLEIRKINTYKSKLDNVETVYNKIKELKPFTIEGYQYTIKKEKEDIIVYVNKKEIFDIAIENAISTFVGKNEYRKYKNEEQEELSLKNRFIENTYIEENMTIKKSKIATNEEIYLAADDLSKYILFSTTDEQKQYKVKLGDTVETVANKNKINVEEFLTANPDFTSVDNILVPGQEVNVAAAEPLVNVIIEAKKIETRPVYYNVEERYSNNLNMGQEQIIQQGKNGTVEVTSLVKSVNGNIVFADPIKSEETVSPTNKIVLLGTKYQSHIGGAYWAWPVGKGWGVSSDYGWRYEPWSGKRVFHPALDIYAKYGSPIYAANNGKVTLARFWTTYGYAVIIDHNNGYSSLYAHMSKFAPGLKVGNTVGKGQLIGYIGTSGNATGPHVHYEIWSGKPFGGGRQINPWDMHR